MCAVMKIYRFPVLKEGWEIDSNGWIAVRPDGTRTIILTNHGNEYEAAPEELHDLIRSYERVISDTKMGLDLLDQRGPGRPLIP